MTRISKILTLCATYKDTWSFLPNLEASASRLSRLSDDSAKFLSSLKALGNFLISFLNATEFMGNSYILTWKSEIKYADTLGIY